MTARRNPRLPYVQPQKQRVAKVASIPAPIGGWNARDSKASMEPTDAVIMENMRPMPGAVVVRNGCENWKTGMTGAVETLLAYASGGTRKLFGAANNAFYDVTTNGAVGAAVDTGHTNNRFQYVNFGTAGGNFIIAVNGADSPRKYDGATWSTNSITGVTDSTLIGINVFKNRLFFVQSATLTFWYLPVSTISGAAQSFNLAPYCSLGGELQAIGTWTVDGGQGSDDYVVFLTTNGEALIYRGDDPSLSSSWFLVGVFKIGRPIGRRCFVKMGSDLVVITEDGYVPLSKSLITGRAVPKVAISDKISGAVSEATRNYGTKFGWQAILYPQGDMVLFNVPIFENEETEQHVFNLITNAWCKFTGWNAYCFEVIDGGLYFGTDTKVVLADVGTSDFVNTPIVADVEPAFNTFGSAAQKRFTMVRPVLIATGDITPAIVINTDFDMQEPTNVISANGNASQTWASLTWPTWTWNGTEQIKKGWQSVAGIGYTATMRMKMSSINIQTQLLSIDYLYEPGGVL